MVPEVVLLPPSPDALLFKLVVPVFDVLPDRVVPLLSVLPELLRELVPVPLVVEEPLKVPLLDLRLEVVRLLPVPLVPLVLPGVRELPPPFVVVPEPFVLLLLLLLPLLLFELFGFVFVLLSLKEESLLSVFFKVLQSSFKNTGCVPVPFEMESIIGTNT